MTQQGRKRLIEVAFPLEEVSAHSRREKNVRHGHISTLHIWWARRPLAACRAFIYASLVNDPSSDAEREELLKEVADLASWDAVRHPEKVIRTKEQGGSGLTGTVLLERARQRILDDNDGKPPKLLDPFAGGGAIPLEGLRLGCEVEASDLNPVAVLILKCTLEYPQKYGQPNSRPVPDYIHQAASDPTQARFTDGDMVEAYRKNPLATDVRYWGHWMLEKAREELAEFYPPGPDGSVPVAYLWSRTIPCPSCHAEMPLIRQYWLARKEKKRVALEPVLDRENNRVDFKVVQGDDVTGNPAEATTSRGDTKCLLCGQVVKADRVKDAGRAGKMSAVLTSVVTSRDKNGKGYRVGADHDLKAFQAAAVALEKAVNAHLGELSLVPDEPVAEDPRNIWCDLYGLNTFGKLFNARQLLAMTTFARLVGAAHAQMLTSEMDVDYAKAVATYLGLAVSRYSDFACTLTRWKNDAEAVVGAMARQAIPMVWDYAEHAAVGSAGGSFLAMTDRVATAIEVSQVSSLIGVVHQSDARLPLTTCNGAVVSDPPYYDSINYSDLSDFFYVWLKRAIGYLDRELLSLPLTPKREQIIMNVYASNGTGGTTNRREEARERYVGGMAHSFHSMALSVEPEGNVGIVFAHTDPDAWATLIQGLIEADLVPNVSWPIDTELQNKVSSLGQARLSTSVWMACRKREEEAGDAFIGDVMEEMRPVIRERLLYFWGKGIRGADFFISAIGPALSVFGRYSRVLRPDGDAVSVREFLDIVRKESTTVALEQVLHGADLGVIDPPTRQYATWVWSYSKSPLDAGEAIALCLATGASYDDTTRPHSIATEAREKSKKVVRLRTIRQRAAEDEDLGYGTAARPAPLIDQLQWAAHLWSQNRMDQVGTYRGQLGESRWTALRTLGQAVAECLPDGDEDRRIILGLLGSNVMAGSAPTPTQPRSTPAGAQLPGFDVPESSET